MTKPVSAAPAQPLAAVDTDRKIRSATHRRQRRSSPRRRAAVAPPAASATDTQRNARRDGNTPYGTDSDPAAIAREIVSLTPGAYALQAEDDSMRDARVGPGDVVLIQPVASAFSGELVALRLPGLPGTYLRRVYFENGNARLQPEDRRAEPLTVAADSFELHGRVMAIIRQPSR